MNDVCIVFDHHGETLQLWYSLLDRLPKSNGGRGLGFGGAKVWLKNTYDCDIIVESQGARWTLIFPDLDTKTEFVLTWMS